MPSKAKTITKNQRKVDEKIMLKNNKNKKLHDKIDSSYDFLLHRRQHFLFRREIYNYTCKSPYTEKFRNICFQSSGSRCLVKGFLQKDEAFPSPLIQICLQFKGMLNVDWTSRLWCFETINSILLLMSVLYLLIIYNLILKVGSLASTIFKFYN